MYKVQKIQASVVLVFAGSKEEFESWAERSMFPRKKLVFVTKRRHLKLFDRKRAMIRFVGSYQSQPKYQDFANFAVSKGFFSVYG